MKKDLTKDRTEPMIAPVERERGRFLQRNPGLCSGSPLIYPEKFRYGFSVNRLVAAVKKRTRQPAIPVRVCPQCGYRIRTWADGNISCTRCENDIGASETGEIFPQVCREAGVTLEQ